MKFTETEKQLIDQYADMPTAFSNRLNIWAVELIPPLVLIVLGIYLQHQYYLVAAICALVFFNVLRLYKQEPRLRMLKSLFEKIRESYKTEMP